MAARKISGMVNRWRDVLAATFIWLERIDPGTHRRIKGLRLVTAYGIAALLGTLPDITHGLQNGASLSALAGGFALWASVFEARTTRAESSRDLALLCAADVLGAAWMIIFRPVLSGPGRPGPELSLVLAAFLVSDDATALTGNIEYIDAGYHIIG